MTVGDLMDLFKSMQGESHTPESPQSSPLPPTMEGKRLAYGISGIAQLFNCSMTTANRIKGSGIIDKAIAQYRHTIVVDADLALQLMAESKKNEHNQQQIL